MAICIGRRDVIAALGGAVAWPVVARAQPMVPYKLIGTADEIIE